MHQFTCCCKYVYVVGKRRVFGPMFAGPEPHQGYWHMGQMMTRAEFEDQYADCAACDAGKHRHHGHA